MAQYRIKAPDGTILVVEGPEDATDEELERVAAQHWKPKGAAAARGVVEDPEEPVSAVEQVLLSGPAAGLARGLKDVVDTGADFLTRGVDSVFGTNINPGLAAADKRGRERFKQVNKDTGIVNSIATGGGRLVGNVVGTLPIVNAAGGAAAAGGLTRLGNAIRTGGMTTGAARAPGALSAISNMATRIFGGSIAGGLSAGAVDPDDAVTGAVVGGALPPAFALAGYAGNSVGQFLKPFYKSGQEDIASKVFWETARDPRQAMENLRNAPAPLIPGSEVSSVAAAGDEGLSGLNRAMQNASGEYAAELANRGYTQNAARTEAMEELAGNRGKIKLAQEMRDAATRRMREESLNAAGQLPVDTVLKPLERMLADPNNAGRTSQAALRQFMNDIQRTAKDGLIDARALYEIRKDIGLLRQGKLQGEQGNLRWASGQLDKLQEVIDDAIDMGTRRMTSGTAVGPVGPNVARQTAPYAEGARPTWRTYLQTYADMSIPINQMEKLEEVLKAAQTGTTDKFGNPVISGAKLNNVLRTDKDLLKKLSQEQIDLLRRLAADLNANTLALNSGRSVGSNTVQNAAQDNFLRAMLGDYLGSATPTRTILGNALKPVFYSANKDIMEKVSAGLLDPKEALRLMERADPAAKAVAGPVKGALQQLPYRTSPLLATDQ